MTVKRRVHQIEEIRQTDHLTFSYTNLRSDQPPAEYCSGPFNVTKIILDLLVCGIRGFEGVPWYLTYVYLQHTIFGVLVGSCLIEDLRILLRNDFHKEIYMIWVVGVKSNIQSTEPMIIIIQSISLWF